MPFLMKFLWTVLVLLGLTFCGTPLLKYHVEAEKAKAAALERGDEGILVKAPGYETVKVNCTGCHSARLIVQNRQTREGWLKTIRWMQETQNLWQFDPKTEKVILDYLATYYGPERENLRRPPLEVKEWQPLEE